MTTNESRIYGTLLILASLMVIALVVMGAPERERVKCQGYNLSFKIEEERDTFLIGERVTIVNETNNVRSLEWIVPEVDSVVVGKSMQEQSLVLVFTREGKKNIQLRINDRKDCTTVAKRIFIMPHCSDGEQNGSETDIDCGGNCPPCGGIAANTGTGNSTPPPARKPTCYDGRQNGSETGIDCGGNCPRRCKTNSNTGSLPQAYIVRIKGELKCDTDISFDCGIPDSYNPVWSFDDLRTKKFSGMRVTHKFADPGRYMVRVYINDIEVGRKPFDIADCTIAANPSPVSPPVASNVRIVMPPNLNCEAALTFSANSGANLRWQLDNGARGTGNYFYHTFKEGGTHTIKLYSGSSPTPVDSKTFNVKCNTSSTTPSTPLDVELAPTFKAQFQEITQKSKRVGGNKLARKIYKGILNDASMCDKQSTMVIVNNSNEKTLDSYYQQLINEKIIITEVRYKKPGNCIEKILINQHKK